MQTHVRPRPASASHRARRVSPPPGAYTRPASAAGPRAAPSTRPGVATRQPPPQRPPSVPGLPFHTTARPTTAPVTIGAGFLSDRSKRRAAAKPPTPLPTRRPPWTPAKSPASKGHVGGGALYARRRLGPMLGPLHDRESSSPKLAPTRLAPSPERMARWDARRRGLDETRPLSANDASQRLASTFAEWDALSGRAEPALPFEMGFEGRGRPGARPTSHQSEARPPPAKQAAARPASHQQPRVRPATAAGGIGRPTSAPVNAARPPRKDADEMDGLFMGDPRERQAKARAAIEAKREIEERERRVREARQWKEAAVVAQRQGKYLKEWYTNDTHRWAAIGVISRLMRAAVMRRVNIKRMYMDKIAERLHLAVRIEGLAKRRKEMKRLRLEAEAEAEARRAAREQRLAEEAEAERKAEEELIAGFYAHWAFRPPKVHEKAFQAEVDEMRPKLKVALHNIAARKKKDAVGAVALKKANSILPIESVAT